MVGSGGALIAAAGVGLIVYTLSSGDLFGLGGGRSARDIDEEAERRRRRALGFAIAAPAILVFGGSIALIVVGSERKRQLKNDAARRGVARFRILPTVGTEGAAATLRFSF